MADAAPVAPVAPTTAAPTTTPASPAPVDWEARAKSLQTERDLKVREAAILKRSLDGKLREANTRIAELSPLQQREAYAKLNPEKYLTDVYGKDWYNIVVGTKLNGVAPADLMASEVMRLEEKFNGELAKRDAAAKQREEEFGKAESQRTQKSVEWQAIQVAQASKDATPLLLERHGSPEALGRMAFAHVKKVWDESAREDASNPYGWSGNVISFEEALQQLEKQERAYIEKSMARLTPQTKPETIGGASRLQRVVAGQSSQQVGQSSQPPQRKTLSNDITGSTQSRTPPKTEAERRQAFIDAFNSVHKRGPA